MTDGGMVGLALLVTVAICGIAFGVLRSRARNGKIDAGSAGGAFGFLCIFAGIGTPIVTYLLIFKSGVPIVGSHNTGAVLFFGVLANIVLAILISGRGASVLSRMDLGKESHGPDSISGKRG